MFGKNTVVGGGSAPGGDPPGLEVAMTVMAVVAVIGGAEQLGLWPAALNGAAGTVVPAGVVVVLAVRRVAGRVGGAIVALWARGRTRLDGAAAAKFGADRGGNEEPGEDAEENAAVLAVHLPDPTLFPPIAANDDEKDKPTAM